MLHLPRPASRRIALLLVTFALSLLSCGREVTGPSSGLPLGGRFAAVSVDPEMPSLMAQLVGGSQVVPFERVRVVILKEDGTVAVDTIVRFPAEADSVALALLVPLPASTPSSGLPALLTLAYINAQGDTVFRGGPTAIQLRPVGSPGATTPIPVTVRFDGVGANAARIELSAAPDTVLSGTSSSFTATAFDEADAVLAGTPILFYTLDSTRAELSNPGAGTVNWLAIRGAARIVAALPDGRVADTVSVTVALPASQLVLGSGGNQSAGVGALLGAPVVVRTLASDGVPVGGTEVTFAVATGGGSLSALVDTTEGSGNASTEWTLGAALGPQSLTATAAGLEGSPLTILATAEDGGAPSAPFVTRWDTNLGTGTTVTLGLAGAVDATIDWGDGTVTPVTGPGPHVHDYGMEGIYTVAVTGSVPAFNSFDNGGGASEVSKLTEVVAWGDVGFTSLFSAFRGATNLTAVPTSSEGIENVVNMGSIFRGASAFNHSIGGWNTAGVTNMSDMFRQATAFNQDIGGWNTANVTTMNSMFLLATAFNQAIGGWNTANVTDMNGMFFFATAFNQDIGGWNTANVTTMNSMFRQATAFNQEIGGWNTAGVTNMTLMFSGATAFNHSIGGWSTTNVTNMNAMFLQASAFNQDIGDWNTANVTNMGSMFAQATAFNHSIGGWNTANVTNMNEMFFQATAFNQNLAGWCVSNIPSAPVGFDEGATAWVLANSRPVWGTCPSGVPASIIRIVSEPGAEHTAGVPLAPALIIEVLDADSNVVTSFTGAVSVVLAENPTSATLQGTLTVNAVAGIATFSDLDVRVAGDGYTLAVSADGLDAVETSAFRIITAAPSTTTITEGNDQTGILGTVLPDSLAVRIADAFDNGISGLEVTFAIASGGGSLSPATTPTDTAGVARSEWTLGPAEGAQVVNVTAPGAPPAVFGATAIARVAQTIAQAVPANDFQTGTVGEELGAQFRVFVSDTAGVGVEGVEVTWTAITAGASFPTATNLTDADGIAEAVLTLPTLAGTVQATASVAGLDGSPVSFNANAIADLAGNIDILTPPVGGTVGVPLPAFSAVAQDQYGNIATGFEGSVTLSAVVSGIGAVPISSGDSVVAALGVATFDNVVLTTSGSVQFTIDFGVDLGTYVTAFVPVEAGDAVSLALVVAPDTVLAGLVAPAITLEARDTYGNRATSFTGTVTASVTDNPGGTLGGTLERAASAGVATFDDFAFDGLGAWILEFTADALTPLVLAVEAVTDMPALFTIVSGDGQTGAATQALGDPLVVRVSDAQGYSIIGDTVIFYVAEGGGTLSSGAAFDTTLTNGAGEASTTWTLGTDLGAGHVVRAAFAGLPELEFTATAQALIASRTWSGAVSSLWSVPGNWVEGAVPTATDSVHIPAGAANASELDNTYSITRLTVDDGATLALGNSALLVSGSVRVPGAPSVTRSVEGEFVMEGNGMTLSGALPILAITNGLVSLTGPSEVATDLSISGAGALSVVDQPLTVGGELSTVGAGTFTAPVTHTLRMSGATPSIAFSDPVNTPLGSLVVTDGSALTLGGTGILIAGDVILEGTTATITSVNENAVGGGLFDAVGGRWSGGALRFLNDNPALPVAINAEVVFAGSVTLTDSLIVGGALRTNGATGALTLNGNLVRAASFRTSEGGRLVMANPSDSLFAGGTVDFEEGASTLTAGFLSVGGSFFQSGAPESFQAGPAHATWFVGAGAASIGFSSPGFGAGTSHFGELYLAKEPGVPVALNTDVFVNGMFETGAAPTYELSGLNTRLVARGADIADLTFTDVRLELVDGAELLSLQNLRFAAMDVAATQLRIARPGGVVALGAPEFLTVPDGGLYLVAEDTAPLDGDTLTINVSQASPALTSGLTLTLGGAIITGWDEGAGPVIWTGAVSETWTDPANWDGGAVPGIAHLVTIPGGTPFNPALVLVDSTIIGGLTMAAGAVLTLVQSPLLVNGSIDLDGTASMSADIDSPLAVIGTGGTVRGPVPSLYVSGDGNYALNGLLAVSGDLGILAGDLAQGVHEITVGGSLSVSGTGTLTQTAGGTITVEGDALFLGGSSTGRLTNGLLRVRGDFVQGGDPASFDASGTHITEFAPSLGTPIVTFLNPGTSGFANLEISSGRTELGTATAVRGNLTFVGGPELAGPGSISVAGDITSAEVFAEFFVPRVAFGGAFNYLGIYDADMTEFTGTGQVIPTQPNAQQTTWRHVIVSGTTTFSGTALSIDGLGSVTIAPGGELAILSGGSIDLFTAPITADFGGTLRVATGGALRSRAHSDIEGALVIESGASAIFNSGGLDGQHLFPAGSAVSGAGTFDVNGANLVEVAGAFDVGALALQNATLAFVGTDTAFVGGGAYAGGGFLRGTGVVGIRGSFSTTFGNLNGTGTFAVLPGGTLSLQSPLRGWNIDVLGTLQWGDWDLSFQEDSASQQYSSVAVRSGGVFDLLHGTVQRELFATGTEMPPHNLIVVNEGGIIRKSTGTGTGIFRPRIEMAGIFDILSGTINVQGTCAMSGSVTGSGALTGSCGTFP